MNAKTRIIVALVEVIESAIASGDWKVDGACDPADALYDAEQYLVAHGFTRNGIDGHLQEAP